jgi:hypothetical protein
MREHRGMPRLDQPSPGPTACQWSWRAHLKTFCTTLSGRLSFGCRLSSLRLHAAVTYIAKQSNANGKKPKYPGIGISKMFPLLEHGKDVVPLCSSPIIPELP